jgi:class 3 adenylate cyclase/predicted ATPase
VICAACGFDSPEGFKFCGGCGAPMTAAPGAAQPTTPPSPKVPLGTRTVQIERAALHLHIPRGEAERRQVSVVFCDLVGSTALSEQLDPEDLRDLIWEYQQVCAAVVERFGGHVAQYLGDGILVYFGYPQAHEDDTRRAVLTALGIVRAIAERNHAARHALAVRLGIHTGPVVAGEMGSGARLERLALGQTPNIAARLEGLAQPGTVVLSEATYRLVKDFFTFESLGAHRLKGVSQPVGVYRAVEERDAREDGSPKADQVPMIGREEELARLLQHLEPLDPAAGGQGVTLSLGGEAGIGKSRLQEELRRPALARGYRWLVCRSSPFRGGSAFHPILGLLEQEIFGVRRGEDAATRIARMEERLDRWAIPREPAIALLATFLEISTEAYPPLLLSPQRQREKTLTLILEILAAAAAEHPTLVVVEDLHWADPSTLEFLGRLVVEVPKHPLLLLCTFRPSFEPPWRGALGTDEIQIGRLTEDQVRRLILHLTGGRPLPEVVEQQIVARTDGVPIFVEELTRMVLESTFLERREDRYVLAGALPPMAIPETLQGSLMARLDRLGSARQVAQQGAAFGREFSYQMLLAAFPEEEGDLRASLDALVEAEILLHSRDGVEENYSFRHALIQDAAYTSLLKSTQRLYHQRIATVLAADFPSIAERQPEILARHYTAGAMPVEAIDAWQRAGQMAAQRSANQEAVEHLRRGLELIDQLPPTADPQGKELALQSALGASLATVKGFSAPEVEACYNRALELCRQIGDTPELFWVYWGLWAFHIMRAGLDQALELGQQLVHLATVKGDDALLMEARFAVGSTLFVRGELPAALEELEAALVLDTEDRDRSAMFITGQEVGVTTRSYAALVAWFLGEPETARGYNRAALERARGLEHPFTLSSALTSGACLHQYLGEAQQVADYSREIIDLAEEMGFFWSAQGTLLLGWALARGAEEGWGDHKDGLERVHEGIEGLQAAGTRLTLPYCSTLAAEIYGEQGKVPDGLRLIEDAMKMVEETGERYYEAELHRLQGKLLLVGADAERAEPCFQRALEIARSAQSRALELRAANSLARLWQRTGRAEEARQLLAPIHSTFSGKTKEIDVSMARELLAGMD